MNDISSLIGRLNARVKYRHFHEPTAGGRIQAPRYAAPLRESELEPEAPQAAEPETPPAPELPIAPHKRAEPEIFFIAPRSDGAIIEPARAPRPAAGRPDAPVAVAVVPVAALFAPVAEAPAPLRPSEPEIFFIAPRSEGGIIEPPKGALEPRESAAPPRPRRRSARPTASSRFLTDIFTRIQRKPR